RRRTGGSGRARAPRSGLRLDPREGGVDASVLDAENLRAGRGASEYGNVPSEENETTKPLGHHVPSNPRAAPLPVIAAEALSGGRGSFVRADKSMINAPVASAPLPTKASVAPLAKCLA